VLASGPSGPTVELSAEQRAAERARWARPGESLAVVFGLAARSKRLDLALEALRLLREDGCQLRLLMLGDLEAGDRDYCREIRARTISLGLDPFVTWSGPRPAEELSRALASADFMWHLERGGITTRNTTAALALANGLPVVALSGDALDGPFRDGENTLLVGEPSARALAAAAARVLDSPELARRLRTGGRRLYETVFAWPVIVGGYLRLMERAKLC
jgi:glycosyltransferase involved in cell wall biosynthesis